MVATAGLAGKVAYTNAIDSEPGERLRHCRSQRPRHCAWQGLDMRGGEQRHRHGRHEGMTAGLLIEKSDLTEGSEVQAILDATNHGAAAINMSFGTEGSAPASPAARDAVQYAYRHNVVWWRPLPMRRSRTGSPGQCAATVWHGLAAWLRVGTDGRLGGLLQPPLVILGLRQRDLACRIRRLSLQSQ